MCCKLSKLYHVSWATKVGWMELLAMWISPSYCGYVLPERLLSSLIENKFEQILSVYECNTKITYIYWDGKKKKSFFQLVVLRKSFFFPLTREIGHWRFKDYLCFYSALLKTSMAWDDDAFTCLYKVCWDFWLALHSQIRCSCNSKHGKNIASRSICRLLKIYHKFSRDIRRELVNVKRHWYIFQIFFFFFPGLELCKCLMD